MIVLSKGDVYTSCHLQDMIISIYDSEDMEGMASISMLSRILVAAIFTQCFGLDPGGTRH